MSEEDTSDQETDYDQSLSEGASYIDDTWSEEDDDYGHEPDIGELEPDPPDQERDHSSLKRWYEEEDEWGGTYHEQREESWTEDDSSLGGNEEEPGRGGLNLKSSNSKQRPTYETPYRHQPEVTLNFNYESCVDLRFYEFSGSSKDYLRWESNMDEYFKYYSIPKGERLTYCLDQLRGEARRWWYQEEEYRWYYKEPTIKTWGQLKWIMREEYAPHSLPKASKNTYPPKETSRRDAIPNMRQNGNSKSVKRQELVTHANAERRREVQEKNSALVPTQAKTNAAATVESPQIHLEVSTSAALPKFDQLCDKLMHLIKSRGVEGGLGTKEEHDLTNYCDLRVNKKHETVSASNNEKVQAKLSPPVYQYPMTGMMHLSLSKSVERGTGPNEEQSKRAGHEEKTNSKLSTLELEPPDPGKSSNPLKLPELVCYRCQGIGHMAKACPTKRLVNEKSIDSKNVGAKESNICDKPDLNIPNASIIHLSLPKAVETCSGMIRKGVDQKETPAQLSNQEKAQYTTHSMLSRETIPLDPEVEKDVAMKVMNLEAKVSLTFPLEKYDQSVLETLAPTDLAAKKTIFKVEPLQNVFGGIQVSDIQNLIQYWNNFIVGKSLNNFVIEIPMSCIMHLLLSLSVSKETGAMEKYKGLEEATSKPNTFSDQHLHEPHSIGITKETSKRSKHGKGFIMSLLIKEKPPDMKRNVNPQAYQGKTLRSKHRMKANLLSLGAGYIVSRSKPFQEGEYDEDIKSTSTKEHEEHAHKMTKTLGEDQLGHLNDIGPMIGAERETKAYQWAVTVCTLFPYPWFCPNGFYRKGFNEANWFTYLKPIRKLVGLHGDLRSLFESLRPNREELSCELTWSRILIQFWFSSNWIHTKSYFGLKDIKFLTRRILHLPYLELFEFERLQTYIWRPGDNLNLIEASRVQAKSKDLVPFLLFFSFRELSFFGLLVERFVVFVFSFASLVVLSLEP